MIPLATTTGSVLRITSGTDPYEAAAPAVASSGHRSHISAPTGAEIDQGGQLERIDAVLLTEELVDLTHEDLWRDDPTGDLYRVSWVRQRQGLGLDHTKAGLVAWDGGSGG